MGGSSLGEPDGTATWVPVSDHPSDKAGWRTTIVTPAGLTGVGNGRLVSQGPRASGPDGPGRRASRWPATRCWGWWAATTWWSAPWLGGPHLTFAFPPESSATDRSCAVDRYEEIVDFFVATFGPYPAADAGAIVVTADLGVALETHTRPIFSDRWIRDGQVEALAHEIAHEWFGNAVSPASWTDLLAQRGVRHLRRRAVVEPRGGHARGDPAARRHQPAHGPGSRPHTPEAAQTFSPAVYGGGARAIHALRLEVGDEAFWRIVRAWLGHPRRCHRRHGRLHRPGRTGGRSRPHRPVRPLAPPGRLPPVPALTGPPAARSGCGLRGAWEGPGACAFAPETG